MTSHRRRRRRCRRVCLRLPLRFCLRLPPGARPPHGRQRRPEHLPPLPLPLRPPPLFQRLAMRPPPLLHRLAASTRRSSAFAPRTKIRLPSEYRVMSAS